VAFPALIPVEKTRHYALFISSLPPSNCGIAICLIPPILSFVRGRYGFRKAVNFTGGKIAEKI